MNTKGLYNKFIVTRTNGKSNVGEEHAQCSYLVLDLNHDKFAKPAVFAYAKACEKELPELSKDLYKVLEVFPFCEELVFPKPGRKDGEEPCGECHLRINETCDICGAIKKI